MQLSYEDEITLFFTLCPKNDVKILNSTRKKRNPEDFARLIIVAFQLGFSQVGLAFLAEAEKSKIHDKVFENMKIAKKDTQIIKKWVVDFLINSPANNSDILKDAIEGYIADLQTNKISLPFLFNKK